MVYLKKYKTSPIQLEMEFNENVNDEPPSSFNQNLKKL